MPDLAPPAANPDAITKLILMGDSGTGKTASLASLAKAGYELFILDYDCKIQTGMLPHLFARDKLDFSKLHFEPLRDDMKSTQAGFNTSGTPKALMEGSKLMDKWSDGTAPAQWGSKKVLVIDSLTFLANAAFNYAVAMNPGAKDPRQWYGTAQDMVENTLAFLTSEKFHTNVVVIAHVSWVERQDGLTKGYPQAVGKALGPVIPAYFDNMLLAESVGSGANVKRTIRTVSTGLVDVKTPAAFKLSATLPIETGLADFFNALRT